MSQESRISSFKDLVAWRKSMDLCSMVYQETISFPDSEKFGLSGQVRRACVSIPSNIAEGFGRQSGRERLRFYEIARGSSNEVETQLTIAKEIGYISNEQFDSVMELLNEVHALVRGLINKTRQKSDA